MRRETTTCNQIKILPQMFTIFKKNYIDRNSSNSYFLFPNTSTGSIKKLNCKMNRNCKIEIQNELFMVVNTCIHIDFIPLKFDSNFDETVAVMLSKSLCMSHVEQKYTERIKGLVYLS